MTRPADPSCIHPPRRTADAVRRGFTLLELLAVLVVTSIVAVTAIPAITSVADTRAGAAAQELFRDMTFARQRAVASGTRSWVVFDAAAETWSVLAEDPANPGRAGAAAVTDPGTQSAMTRRLGANAFVGLGIAGVSFDGASEIGFDWLGRPLVPGPGPLVAAGVVTLTSGRTVTVEPGTGHITLSP